MIGRLLPMRNLLGLYLIVGLLAMLALTARWYSGPGELRQVSDASFEQSMPDRPSVAAKSPAPPVETAIAATPSTVDQPVNPGFTRPETVQIKPAAPDLDLVDASPSGPLPRISNDGRLPLLAYGRPFDRSEKRPKIAIMVTGLGPQSDATNATFHLPAAISLSFSPYTEDLPSLFERARLAGHEVLIELPMEPVDYPANDPGPHTLRASGTVDANLERLAWVLSRAPGYFAVTGPTGAFGASPEAEPVVKAVATKGVGMVEIDGDGLVDQAEKAGLAYTSTLHWIDETPSIDAIDKALADLEAKAKADGTAIGVSEAYPITLQRLVKWINELETRGIALVPVSAVLIERNGLLGASDNDQASGSNIAQSQN